jgi:hypothetical protein
MLPGAEWDERDQFITEWTDASGDPILPMSESKIVMVSNARVREGLHDCAPIE